MLDFCFAIKTTIAFIGVLGCIAIIVQTIIADRINMRILKRIEQRRKK